MCTSLGAFRVASWEAWHKINRESIYARVAVSLQQLGTGQDRKTWSHCMLGSEQHGLLGKGQNCNQEKPRLAEAICRCSGLVPSTSVPWFFVPMCWNPLWNWPQIVFGDLILHLFCLPSLQERAGIRVPVFIDSLGPWVQSRRWTIPKWRMQFPNFSQLNWLCKLILLMLYWFSKQSMLLQQQRRVKIPSFLLLRCAEWRRCKEAEREALVKLGPFLVTSVRFKPTQSHLFGREARKGL